jgi:2-keto-3-deoxy-L-rhamnonate aldolase RhmA
MGFMLGFRSASASATSPTRVCSILTILRIFAALDHPLSRDRAAGKFIGDYAPSSERGVELSRQGFDLVSIRTDTGFLRAGSQAVFAVALNART